MGLAKINIRFTVDMQQFSTDMQGTIRRMQQLGTQMNAVGKGLTTYVTAPLLLAGGAAVKFASDYQESVNKVDVAFGSASTSVKSFAKDSLQSFGIAEGSALDAAAQYGDMATSMGINQQAASKMSTSLVGLAGDLASFKNIGIDQANTALAGVFTGETESLKKLGIVMTEANLQQFALSKGIKTQVKDMDQASKVNLRYAYIMANTTNAQGDFARTGGGAANQSRIFTESLKQLGQQFGTIILPFFTKAITYVNGIIKGFGDLSTETKTLIVVVAGFAAGIGPLLVGLGNLIGFIPRLIVQFKALKVVMAANPVTAWIVGLSILGGLIYSFVSSTKEAVTSQTALNNAIAKGNENAAAEVSTLDNLYKTATNVKLSINERKKAVDELQAQYPAYFANIKDEIILNGKAESSYKELRDAIFNKSRAAAIDGELQSRANDRIKNEIALREKIAATEAEIVRIKKGGNEIVLQEASAVEKTARVTISKTEYLKAQNQLLKNQQKDLENFTAKNKAADELLFQAKSDYLKKTGKLEENEVDLLNGIKIGTDAIKNSIDAVAPGTIAFYESQIKALQKLQKEQATTNSAWLQYQNNIDAIQKKIDALSKPLELKINKPKADYGEVVAPPSFSLSDLEDQLSYYENARKQFATTSAEYKALTDNINNTKIKIQAIEGIDNVGFQIDNVKTKMEEFSASVNSAIQGAVASFAEGFGTMLGTLINGGNVISSIGNLFLGTLADLMIRVGKIAIETGIAIGAIKKALSTLNPAVAIGAGVLLIALGSAVKSNIAGSFATGGIVGGSSYYGDKILARVNSGEMIANEGQQKAIWNGLNGGSNVNVNVSGGFKLSGTDLITAIERTEISKSRKG